VEGGNDGGRKQKRKGARNTWSEREERENKARENNKRLTELYNKEEAALKPAALKPAALTTAAVGAGEFVTEGSAGPQTPHAIASADERPGIAASFASFAAAHTAQRIKLANQGP
jgi:hypothetical protein